MTLPGDPADGLPLVDFSTVGPALGERFPDLVLPAQTGRPVDLHEHRAGRPLILAVHRSADW